MKTRIIVSLSMLFLAFFLSPVFAGKPIQLSPDKPYIYVIHDGMSVRVQRSQDPNYTLQGYFAHTGRPCPPACLKPMEPAPGVRPVGEAELFKFMENEMRNNTGLLVDARTDSWWNKGTIPGAVHVPHTLMTQAPNSPGMNKLLKQFGAKPRGDVGWLEKWGFGDNKYKTKDWDFTQAKDLIIFCNGPSCGQSPRAIRGLVKAGYPADKIRYYRGGMRMWQFWGLNTIMPNVVKKTAAKK